MKQETGFEWLDDVSDEVRDMCCKKCRCITEHEVNPVITDGCGNIVFGWTCLKCGDWDEMYEKEKKKVICKRNYISGNVMNLL